MEMRPDPREFRFGSWAAMPSTSPVRQVHPRQRTRWPMVGASAMGQLRTSRRTRYVVGAAGPPSIADAAKPGTARNRAVLFRLTNLKNQPNSVNVLVF